MLSHSLGMESGHYSIKVLIVFFITVFDRAEFILTEPIPLQAVYIDHSRFSRLLYGWPR